MIELNIRFEDFCKQNPSFSGIIKTKTGIKIYLKNGKLHREDGPAQIHPDGTEEWFLNGQLHRNDGLPAVIHSKGHRAWYTHGKLNRNDGPAQIFSYPEHTNKRWWLDDTETTAEDVFDQMTNEQKEKVIWEMNEWK